MNAFADWLFGTLFGWMGSAANGAWNALVNAGSGISSFFSKYWLLFLLAAIIIGTLLDYAVWLLRWRPYLVWRSWLTRGLRRRRMRRHARDLETADMDDQARDTLAEWVTSPEDNYPVQYEPVAYQQEQVPQYDDAAPAPYYGQSFDEGYAAGPVPEPFAQSYDQQPAEPLWQVPQPMWTESSPASPMQEYSPLSVNPDQPLIDYVQPPDSSYHPALYGDGQNAYGAPAVTFDENAANASPFPMEELPLNGTHSGTRRRRADRKPRPAVKRLFDDIRERVRRGEDEEGMLDGLPSTVRPEDAFHEAVYPKDYRYQDWNNNGNHNA